MKFLTSATRAKLIILTLLLSSCASVQQQAFDLSQYQQLSGKTIGIVQVAAPAAESHYSGQIGLLNYAIIAAFNRDLDSHLKTLSFSDYDHIAEGISDLMSDQGLHAKLIEPPIDFDIGKHFKPPVQGKSRLPLAQIKDAGQFDYLLVIRLSKIGTTRPYHGPTPLEAPQAIATVDGELINTKTKAIHWHQKITTLKIIDQPWDQAQSHYPNVDKALFLAQEEAVRAITKSLMTAEYREAL